jgi:hypothetical protein
VWLLNQIRTKVKEHIQPFVRLCVIDVAGHEPQVGIMVSFAFYKAA